MTFAQALTYLLESRDITVYQLSKDTGMGESMIGRWKRGEGFPSFEKAVAIADYFQVSLDFLAGRIEDPFEHLHFKEVNGGEEIFSTVDDAPPTVEELREIYAAESQAIAEEALDEATKLMHQIMGERFEELLKRRIPAHIDVDRAPRNVVPIPPREHDQPE